MTRGQLEHIAASLAFLIHCVTLVPACDGDPGDGNGDGGAEAGDGDGDGDGECVVSSALFVSEVVPDFLEKHDCSGQTAGGCHAVANANSLYQLEDIAGESAPLPTDPPGSWPAGWQANFERTVAQLGDCEEAGLSPLYSVPAGGETAVHGGGDMFAPGGPELDLIQRWLDGGG